MKNTSLIYEEVLLKNCFNKLKSIRDGWGYEANDKFGLSTIIDIYSDDYFNFESIMKCTESAIFEAIPEIIMYLFEEYKVNINWIQIFEKMQNYIQLEMMKKFLIMLIKAMKMYVMLLVTKTNKMRKYFIFLRNLEYKIDFLNQ